ncbi:zinc transporter ZIP11 [Exaiptasia diaphana]|uniref:Zinc transporter ZIP11 n=1 Tax=Exaiptasia diaphana TaxID=2652724 RepID=A0A913XHD8_EXADI|nr:zinc transporter ZIP11 [Exaiptasia diaphana]KXJ12159.1 Zinc transporter ZIP11 [Exaiptasia diaphana]
MLQNYGRVTQALLGTLFTWAVTAAGSGLVFLFNSGQRKVLDGSLGFAAGVMLAASYWSLLSPAIELAEKSPLYGNNGQLAFLPVSIGFALGAAFVYAADVILPYLGLDKPSIIDNIESDNTSTYGKQTRNEDIVFNNSRPGHGTVTKRTLTNQHVDRNIEKQEICYDDNKEDKKLASWKRIVLLIIAITVHNIPEGLAVGVAFGAIGKTASATFDNARNLAIGIGIQNFPEGLAVSLPLRASGMGLWKSFWYGQLSGMVEPIAGLLGAYAVIVAEPILPYALSFAAGAMVYVVVDDIIPEAQTCGNGKLASWTTIVGFIVMMSLDVGLG